MRSLYAIFDKDQVWRNIEKLKSYLKCFFSIGFISIHKKNHLELAYSYLVK